jgi:hypothetical protein
MMMIGKSILHLLQGEGIVTGSTFRNRVKERHPGVG